MKITFKHGAELHPKLLEAITLTDAYAKSNHGEVVSTDTDRNFDDHINIYKKLYPDSWWKVIPMNSKHLAKWGVKYLEAIDFGIQFNDKTWMKGPVLSMYVDTVCDKIKLIRGLGVGTSFVHLDIRDHKTDWTYA